MDPNNNFKYRFYIFLIFSFIIFVEGFFHMFSRPLSYYIIGECVNSYYVFQECLNYKLIYDNEGKNIGVIWLVLVNYKYHSGLNGYNPYIWNENGIVEILQVIFLLFSIYILSKSIKKLRHIKLISIKFYLYLYLAFTCLFFLEEISWGQHFFKWQSPEFFINFNSQKETNIHNISSIFNEFPRLILSIYCGLSFIIFRYIKINQIKIIFFPSKNLMYISFLFILLFVPNFILDKFFPHLNNSSGLLIGHFTTQHIYQMISFNFIKFSEYEELIFCYYIYCHSLYLKEINVNELDKNE